MNEELTKQKQEVTAGYWWYRGSNGELEILKVFPGERGLLYTDAHGFDETLTVTACEKSGGKFLKPVAAYDELPEGNE